MILEGIVTTLNADGSLNVSPMGPRVDDAMREIILRPFRTSKTYENLKRIGEGVFHVTDDVELFARAAIGKLDPPPASVGAGAVEGRVLADACRWYAFRVVEVDDTNERSELKAEVVDSGRQREFFGFNRAKHAVIEAAILATRVQFLPREEIQADFARLRTLIDKTGGPAEHRAFELLAEFVSVAP